MKVTVILLLSGYREQLICLHLATAFDSVLRGIAVLIETGLLRTLHTTKRPDYPYRFELQTEGEFTDAHTQHIPETALHLPPWLFTSTPLPEQHPVLLRPLTWDLGASLAFFPLQLWQTSLPPTAPRSTAEVSSCSFPQSFLQTRVSHLPFQGPQQPLSSSSHHLFHYPKANSRFPLALVPASVAWSATWDSHPASFKSLSGWNYCVCT